MKQQRTTRLTRRQIARFVENYQMDMMPAFLVYAQISSSVGIGLSTITLPMRETFIKCL